LAGQFVNLLLRERGRENEDKKPGQNLSHAPKINFCNGTSS
jgi:hypothetical protein